MSIIERAATTAGLDLDRDVPKKGSRRCRDWSKLIGIARKLESQETEKQDELQVQVNDSNKRVNELQSEVYRLETKLRNYRLAEEMTKIEIPELDRKTLLAIG